MKAWESSFKFYKICNAKFCKINTRNFYVLLFDIIYLQTFSKHFLLCKEKLCRCGKFKATFLSL